MAIPPTTLGVRAALAATLVVVHGLAALSPPEAHAGAWTRRAGGTFFKLGYDRWFTSERYDTAGRIVPFEAPDPGFVDPSAYRSQALRAYLEFGATPRVTLIAAGSWEWIESEGKNVVRTTSGFGDLWLGARYGVIGVPFVLSLQADLKLPTGYDETASPALGTGKADWGGRLQVGGSTRNFYVTAEAGYLFRGGAPANELPANLEAGFSLAPRVGLRGELRTTVTSSAPRASGGAFDPALAESQSIVGSLGVVLRGSPFDLVFTADRVLDGENTLTGTRYAFSIWHQR